MVKSKAARHVVGDRVGWAAVNELERAGIDFVHTDEQEIFDAYARLLRAAWLNPSDHERQTAVHGFEHQHAKMLEPFWEKWRTQSENET